jgi:hypothetical protein
MQDTIVRSPGGARRRDVVLREVQVPDAWHAAMALKDAGYNDMMDIVLETWHLAHDLLHNLRMPNDKA